LNKWRNVVEEEREGKTKLAHKIKQAKKVSE
jgi:hypothetical protein